MDPRHEILNRLTPICTRHGRRIALQGAGRGLACGSAIAIVLGLANVALATWPLRSALLPDASASLVRWAVLPGLAVAALLLGLLAGARRARPHKPDWRAAAAAVDRHYQLQDRTVTALSFLEKPDPKPLEAMQIADCAARLARIDADAVAHVGVPKPLPAALALAVLALIAIAGPLAVKPRARLAVEAAAKPAAATGRTNQERISHPATVGGIAGQVKWQPAPSGEVTVTRSSLLDGATLAQIITAADRRGKEDRTDSGRAAGSQQDRSTQVVLEGESLPLRHRRTIRRYFESVHPGEIEIRNQPPSAP